MPVLRIEGDESGERTLKLPPGQARIGRSEDAEIQVTEPRSSRVHAAVRTVPGGLIVWDLGSTNGTFKGDRRILQARVQPGESFRIGKTEFTLESSEPRIRRKRGSPAAMLLTLLAPALILVILAEVGLTALASSRGEEIRRAEKRLELAEFRLSLREENPAELLASLRAFVAERPDSPYAEDARERIAELGPRVGRLRLARNELAELSAGSGDLAFSELYYRYEKLLQNFADLPEVAVEVRNVLVGLDRSHREKMGELVGDARKAAKALAEDGQFGRAFSVLTAFTERSPAAASRFKEELGAFEEGLLEAAEASFRELVALADRMKEDGKGEEAVTMLRREAGRFLGTRYHAFLRLKSETVAKREEKRATEEKAVDRMALRRAYYRRAEQAEEFAVAGLFRKAADSYAGILQSIALPMVRKEFENRETELRGLAGLIDLVRDQIAERGREFGKVRLKGTPFAVVGLRGDQLVLEYGGNKVERIFGKLEPEEMLELIRRAEIDPKVRLLAAVYCFDMNLREAFKEEILWALEREAFREDASRLYARKEGISHPGGGFVAYRGRILTTAERAEEIHREQVAKLRQDQQKLHQKLVSQPVFKKLDKLRRIRDGLDKARKHALALIFDTKKYFYPYRHRMGEYTPVQKEVDVRAAAVKTIWDEKLAVSLKPDDAMKRALADIEQVSEELRTLGVDTTEFDRAVAAYTIYLGRTLTIRTFFFDQVERYHIDYNAKVMDHNRKLQSSATEMEKRQVEITNEYRMMMGRRALVLDERLLKTARGHSEEMSREGYFAHESPHPERRWPHQRAAIEGYKGSAVSENIHRGSGNPQGAHYGWVHSSGHHRNILQKLWTEMGTGHLGRYWTQNFGRTKPMKFPEDD